MVRRQYGEIKGPDLPKGTAGNRSGLPEKLSNCRQLAVGQMPGGCCAPFSSPSLCHPHKLFPETAGGSAG